MPTVQDTSVVFYLLSLLQIAVGACWSSSLLHLQAEHKGYFTFGSREATPRPVILILQDFGNGQSRPLRSLCGSSVVSREYQTGVLFLPVSTQT